MFYCEAALLLSNLEKNLELLEKRINLGNKRLLM